ncbi:MAG: TetR/AcrR family transcriptional regulator [Phyllobacterium sp.]
MGRKRVINQDAMLDAAEAVVVRDGAARLTLDSVAELAGISKASVLYAHKNKQALVRAIVERRVANDRAVLGEVCEQLCDTSSKPIRARIVAASVPPVDETRAVAVSLCAALALDDELRANLRSENTKTISNILETSESPRGAHLAYLALEGLKILEYLDLLRLPKDERRTILSEINWLVDTVPDPACELPKFEPTH